MPPLCRCEEPPFHYGDFISEEMGEDQYGAEVSLQTCKNCKRMWLNYLIEEPHYSKSGRWWRVEISPSEQKIIRPQGAREFIESQAWCYIGGSFFESTGQKKNGPIVVR